MANQAQWELSYNFGLEPNSKQFISLLQGAKYFIAIELEIKVSILL